MHPLVATLAFTAALLIPFASTLLLVPNDLVPNDLGPDDLADDQLAYAG